MDAGQRTEHKDGDRFTADFFVYIANNKHKGIRDRYYGK